MDIRSVIDSFGKYQKDLNNKIDYLKKYFSEEEHVWEEYEKLGEKFFLNDKALNLLGDSLQQVNNEDRLLLYDLQDIKCLYELLVEYYPDNLQYQVDLIAYMYNVLDEEDETLVLIEKAEKRIRQTQKYLTDIWNEIKNTNSM